MKCCNHTFAVFGTNFIVTQALHAVKSRSVSEALQKNIPRQIGICSHQKFKHLIPSFYRPGHWLNFSEIRLWMGLVIGKLSLRHRISQNLAFGCSNVSTPLIFVDCPRCPGATGPPVAALLTMISHPNHHSCPPSCRASGWKPAVKRPWKFEILQQTDADVVRVGVLWLSPISIR